MSTNLSQPIAPSPVHHIADLQLLRGFASIYIVVHHILPNLRNRIPSWMGLPFRGGQECVVLFFLLSGFVLYSSMLRHADSSFRSYIFRRMMRLYPMLIMALIFTYLTRCWAGGGWEPIHWRLLIGNLLMLSDVKALRPGVWFDTYPVNPPLWFLSYLFWFYIFAYGVWRLLPAKWSVRRAAVLIAAVIGWAVFQAIPNQLSLFVCLFPVWWMGFEAGREFYERGRLSWRGLMPSIGILAVIAALWSIDVFRLRGKMTMQIGAYPLHEVRLPIAAIVFVVIVLIWQRWKFKRFSTLFGLFGIFAPISYGIYLFHAPLIFMQPLHTKVPLAAELVIYFLITLAMAYLAECIVQPWLLSLFQSRKLKTVTAGKI